MPWSGQRRHADKGMRCLLRTNAKGFNKESGAYRASIVSVTGVCVVTVAEYIVEMTQPDCTMRNRAKMAADGSSASSSVSSAAP
jgi:hypothetical protein